MSVTTWDLAFNIARYNQASRPLQKPPTSKHLYLKQPSLLWTLPWRIYWMSSTSVNNYWISTSQPWWTCASQLQNYWLSKHLRGTLGLWDGKTLHFHRMNTGTGAAGCFWRLAVLPSPQVPFSTVALEARHNKSLPPDILYGTNWLKHHRLHATNMAAGHWKTMDK